MIEGSRSMVVQPRLQVPAFVPVLNPLLRRLIRMGVPMGPNALITVRGRKSGIPRTTAVTVVELNRRRWVIGTFGDVNWVRNLRAAGEATLIKGRRHEQLHSVELTRDEARELFTHVLAPYVGRSVVRRAVLGLLGAGDILADPSAAASGRPVF